jgi:hypothetical protein
MKRNLFLKLACLILISNFITAQDQDLKWKNKPAEEIKFMNSKVNAVKERPAPDAGPTTKMTFEQDVFNFGEISQGELIKNVFVFTNTGKEPLIISNAKGSCGCTVPEFPKDPIMPGEKGQLLVVFNTKNKKGNQSKRVTITANTEPVNTYLSIKGKVNSESGNEKTLIKEERKNSLISNKEIDPSLFTIFPNPSSEVINISMKGHDGQQGEISIFSKDGKTIDQRIIEHIDQPLYSFDITSYTKGIYTVTMKVGDKMRIARQFVVQ